MDVLPWIYWSEGKWPNGYNGGQSSYHKWLASRKIRSVEELEILPVGTKPKDYLLAQSQGHQPSIAWRREAWKEEALDDLPWKDERRPTPVRRTLEPFQRQLWGNFWETGWSAYGLFRAHRHHLELNWNMSAESNCYPQSEELCFRKRLQQLRDK